jgi:hypothetical protein
MSISTGDLLIPILKENNVNRIIPKNERQNILSFRFTVCSDPRMYHHNLGLVLQAIKANVGVPPINFINGDHDSTCEQNREEYDEWWVDDSFIVIPTTGNHEVDTPDPDMLWMRAEYETGNSLRTPLKNITNEDGPETCKETMYSIDYEDVRFVVINPYWDGFNDVGYAMDAKINEYHLSWLKNTLYNHNKKFCIVFCHEPAYPQNRHIGSSLDRNTTTRDQFWTMLEEYGVDIFFNGHSHVYSKYRHGENLVWQIDSGNAGSIDGVVPDSFTFLDVSVYANNIVVDAWKDNFEDDWSKTDTTIIIPRISTGEEPEEWEEPEVEITNTTWNAADKDSNITLENNALTTIMSKVSDGDSGIRSVVGVTSGKWYWEYTISVMDSFCRVGVGNKDASLGLYVGKANSWGLSSDRTKSCNTSKVYSWNPSSSAFEQGSVISIALDMDNNRVFVAVDGDWENDDGVANPVTGVAPMCTALTGTVHAMVTPRNPGNKITANFGASDFTYSVPEGYNSGLYAT